MSGERAARTPAVHRNLGLTAGQQWAVLGLLGVAIWWLWPEGKVQPFVLDSPRTSLDGFLVISCRGVSDSEAPRTTSTARFREQMEAVLRAGFRPVSLKLVRDFLVEGRPLPPRSLLLLLEDGRRETLRKAEEVLAELRFPATMILRIDAMRRRSYAYPLARELRSFAANGRWTFATRGERCPRMVETPVAGEAGPFLTSLRRLPETAAVESPAQWEERVREDIESCAGWLESNLSGLEPFAFVFPYDDDGRRMADDGEALHHLVGSRFPVAFCGRDYAFNPPGTPPLGIRRLEVSPAWSGDELVRRLAAHLPRRAPIVEHGERDWVAGQGSVDGQGTRLVLDPCGGSGAEAWLRGTELWRCASGEAALPVRPGLDTWIYLRQTRGGDFLRLGWSGGGVYLQARVGGGEPRTLARAPGGPEARSVTVRFELLDRRLRFWLVGGEPGGGSVLLPAEPSRGRIGLAVWFAEGEPSPVVFESLKLRWRPGRATTVESLAQLREDLESPADVVIVDGFQLAEQDGELRLTGSIDPALLTLASYQGATVWPRVQLPEAFSPGDANRLAEAVRRLLDEQPLGGVLIDPSRLADARPEVAGAIASSASSPTGWLLGAPGEARELQPLATAWTWVAISAERCPRREEGAVPDLPVVPPESVLLLR